MTNTARAIRRVSVLTVSWKVSASPCRPARSVGGTIGAAAARMKSVASPIATPGFKLKKMVTLVNWFMWFTACGPSDVFQVTSSRSGTRFLPSSDLM